MTAVLELRPSKRKAAIMERMRAAYEEAFWYTLKHQKDEALKVVGAPRQAKSDYKKSLNATTLKVASRLALPEPLASGLSRDVEMAVTSFIELKSNGRPAEWPEQFVDSPERYREALMALAVSTSKEEEDSARDEWVRVQKGKVPRPMTIARERDARFVREKPNGPLALLLNISGPKVKGARKAAVKAGINATTGEALRPQSTSTKLVIPVSCSQWHENKFFSGRTILRSSLIIRKGERWFIAAQFEFQKRPISPECFFGLDRGVANLISGAVVDHAGAVQSVMPVSGNAIGEAMNAADRKAREFQKRTGRSIKLHHRKSHHLLHEVTNGIVAEAKGRRAQVVMEDLSGFKSTITKARPKFSGKGGWRRVLKKAQLGKIEEMLRYKLKAAGLPEPRLVPAGGTSKTCSACGHSETGNRIEQAKFVCLSCGTQLHADMNAAVQIARRGAMKPKKGEKLHDLHKNMVTDLKSRDDDGLGPLLAGAGSGFVAGRASADTPNDFPRET